MHYQVKELTCIFLSSSKCVLYIEGSPTSVFSISTNLDANTTMNHSHSAPITRHTYLQFPSSTTTLPACT